MRSFRDIYDCGWKLQSDPSDRSRRIELQINPREVLLDGNAPVGLIYLDFIGAIYELPQPTSPRFHAIATDTAYLRDLLEFRAGLEDIHVHGKSKSVTLQTYEGQVNVTVRSLNLVHNTALGTIHFYYPNQVAATDIQEKQVRDESAVISMQMTFAIDSSSMRSAIECIARLARALEDAPG